MRRAAVWASVMLRSVTTLDEALDFLIGEPEPVAFVADDILRMNGVIAISA